MLVQLVVGCALLAAAPPAQANDVRTVTVKNVEGLDCDDAVKRALRQAIEQAGKVDVFSKSETENFQLMKDTVLARAVGKVTDYKVLSKQEGVGGTCVVSLEAKVSKELLDATWGEVEILLQQMGRPKIMVFFAERIFDLKTSEGRRNGILDTDSQFQVMIEQKLADVGFELVAKEQVEAIKQTKAAEAAAKDDVGVMQAIAADYGAHLFIAGKANTTGPQDKEAFGTMLHMWETDVTLRAYWTETAGLLFAAGTPEGWRRGGSRVDGRPGAKQALQNTAKNMAELCVAKLLETWTRQAVGGGEIILEVHNCEFKQALAVQKQIEKIADVQEVRRDFKKPLAKLRIKAKISAEKLVELVAEMEFEDFVLEIEDQKLNTITCKIGAP
ncbi:MAG TPA: hypothetical protein VMZ31_10190 [Phycisphaerae bacterium]|nr:hypothetical protein [Phycisphaerae bacterium]